MSSWISVLVAVAISLQMGAAREPAVPRSNGARITGRVVDGTTKAPLAAARVRLTGSAPRGPILTDATGTFVFTDLPRGSYSFTVDRDGYLPASWPKATGWVRRREPPIELTEFDRRDDVTIALERGGVVTGRVTTASAAVAGAQVLLIDQSPAAYVRSGTTDALGGYRFTGVPSGRYLVRAELRPPTTARSDAPRSGPLPTYFPDTVERAEAAPLVIDGNGDVREANVRLVEGTLSLLEVVVTHADGRPVQAAMLTISPQSEPSAPGAYRMLRSGQGTVASAPGEYIVQASAASGRQNTPDRVQYDLQGTSRVRLVPGSRQTVTVIVGPAATAAGRVVFEGDRPPPGVTSTSLFTLRSSDGRGCRSGSWTVAPDWSFTIEGLAGACRVSLVAPLAAHWALKSVFLAGRVVVDDDVSFDPGRHYDDVRIVLTDRRSQVRVRVTAGDGRPTGDYAAVAFPVERDRWRTPDRYIRAAAPLQSAGATGGGPATSVRLMGLPAGDYYLIAVDDIEYTSTRDVAVLEKLARSATRVSIPEDDLIEVPLQRHLLGDVLK